jgi:hypothetical protein
MRAAVKNAAQAVMREKKSAPCTDCGGRFPPVCMQYDHRDPATKSAKVSDLAKSGLMARMLAEIELCDLVCANCHALRTERQQFDGHLSWRAQEERRREARDGSRRFDRESTSEKRKAG